MSLAYDQAEKSNTNKASEDKKKQQRIANDTNIEQ